MGKNVIPPASQGTAAATLVSAGVAQPSALDTPAVVPSERSSPTARARAVALEGLPSSVQAMRGERAQIASQKKLAPEKVEALRAMLTNPVREPAIHDRRQAGLEVERAYLAANTFALKPPTPIAQWPSRHRSDVAEPTSAQPKTKTSLWKKLKSRFQRNPPVFLKKGAVEDNGSHLPCVAHSCIQVKIDGESHAVHANRIAINDNIGTTPTDNRTTSEEAHAVGPSRNTTSASASASASASDTDLDTQPTTNAMTRSASKTEAAEKVFVAGQSPLHFDACEKLMVHAFTTQQGVFQILSPRVHASSVQSEFQGPPPAGAIAPIINQLMTRQSNILGNRYEILSLQPGVVEKDFASFQLQVYDNVRKVQFEMPLTQIGVPFEQSLMLGKDIEHAYWRLNGHIAQNQKIDASRDIEPIIISQAGVGRSATVIVYHAILPMIQQRQVRTPEQLETALENVIEEGRAARGPEFIHTAKQLDELRQSLTKAMHACNATSAPS